MAWLDVMIAAALVLLCAMALVSKAMQTRRPRELRGDWWPEFEREFRAYARRMGPPHHRPQS